MKSLLITRWALVLMLALSCLSTSPRPRLGDGLKRGDEYCQLKGAVYIEEVESFAKYKVFVEDVESFADLRVYKEQAQSFADRPGLWYITDVRAFADFTVAFTDVKGFADFSIYFTDFKTLAGCTR